MFFAKSLKIKPKYQTPSEEKNVKFVGIVLKKVSLQDCEKTIASMMIWEIHPNALRVSV